MNNIYIALLFVLTSCKCLNSDYFIDSVNYLEWKKTYTNNFLELDNNTGLKSSFFLKKDDGVLFLVESPYKGVLNYFPLVSFVKRKNIIKVREEYLGKLFPNPVLIRVSIKLKVTKNENERIVFEIEKQIKGRHGTVNEDTYSIVENTPNAKKIIIDLKLSKISLLENKKGNDKFLW